jgi:hypothetical protein
MLAVTGSGKQKPILQVTGVRSKGPPNIQEEVKMDRRQALKEGMRSLGQVVPLVLGTVVGLKGLLKLTGETVQIETQKPLPLKRKKKPIRRDSECR